MRPRYRLIECLDEDPAVRESRQTVVTGHVADLLAHPAPVGDIPRRGQKDVLPAKGSTPDRYFDPKQMPILGLAMPLEDPGFVRHDIGDQQGYFVSGTGRPRWTNLSDRV